VSTGEPIRMVITPRGGGYMPLYCAVEWIVTRGQAVAGDSIVDEETWRAAYRALLDAIAAEDVKAIGARAGMNEPIPAHHFAACRVAYPWTGWSAELQGSGELYLRACVYIDDARWREGFDDALANRGGDIWQRIMVSKSDVARLWPFTLADASQSGETVRSVRSGAPGRPTPMHLVRAEHRRRRESGEVESSVTAEAEQLARWLQERHPDAPRLTPKTIANNIRAEHNAWKATARK
jgi:hypothetical protein